MRGAGGECPTFWKTGGLGRGGPKAGTSSRAVTETCNRASVWARREEIHVPCPGPGAALPTADLAPPPLALGAMASVAEFLGEGWMAWNYLHAPLHHWRPDVSLAR